MSHLFRRRSAITCFFCHSPVPFPQDPSNFRCPVCQCRNRYDSKGEVMSSDPAMYDESFNTRSFSKRASPSKDRIPTTYGKGPFCRTCQTNQMLLINLLANYLPSPDNPQYERRLAMLPEYRESLHVRYPPVCEGCLPAVEDELHRKDSMARTKALGGWLSQTKGKDTRRRVSAPKERSHLARELNIWRFRGCLWVATLAASLYCGINAALGYPFPHLIIKTQPVLPILTLVSLLWTAWDPTYASYRRAQIQGRDIRVHGKRQYNILQMIAWLSRFATSMFLCLSSFKPHLDFFQLSHLASTSRRLYFTTSLIIEISVSVACAFTIRLQKPPTIRLVDTKSHSLDLRSRSSTPFNPLGVDDNSQIPASNSRRSTPLPSDTDLLASLSLSSKPVITPTNPVFGLPSLLASSSRPEAHPINSMDDDPIEVDRDEMAMDWTPIRPTNRLNVPNPVPGRPKQSSDSDDGAWLRPQRFFAPEKPTGLEGLFERTSIIDETDGETRQPTASTYHFVPRWTYTLAMIPLILSAFAWVAWRGRGGGPPTVTEFPLPYPSYSYHNSQYANINGEQ